MATFYRYYGVPVAGAAANNWGEYINAVKAPLKYGIWEEDGETVDYGSPVDEINSLSANPAFAYVEGATNLMTYLRQQRVGTQLTMEMWGKNPAGGDSDVNMANNAFRFGNEAGGTGAATTTTYYIHGNVTYYTEAVRYASGTQAFQFRLPTNAIIAGSSLEPTIGEVWTTHYQQENEELPADAIFYVVGVMYRYRAYDSQQQTNVWREFPMLYWCLYVPSANYFEGKRIDTLWKLYYEEVDEGDEPDMPTVPALPDIDINAVGVRLFQAGNFNNFISDLWGGNVLSSIEKLIGDQTPYECIIGMNIFPYAGVATVSGGGAWTGGSSRTIYLGNYSTGVSAPTCKQFCEVNFGSVPIQRRFNSALDFAPYTVIENYLTFIGRIRVTTDFVMGKSLGVVYHCDVLTGGVAAFITANNNVIQIEGGSCLIQVPLTAKTADGARQAISSAASAGLSFATAGGMSSKIGTAGAAMSGIGQVVEAISAKDSFSTFGNLALANGFLGVSSPVVYIHRPIPTQNTEDATYAGYMGIAADARVSLSNLHGFTRVKAINLGISGASEEDLAEIEALLKEGVIL